ncbi:hypothetical protein C1O24_20685 [Vibrio diazotrophicus]|nr:hypothetical protein C1O24_20685 [Vibrio diazotrophicus]
MKISILCHFKSPHNKALKSDCKPVAVLIQLASVFTVVILGLVCLQPLSLALYFLSSAIKRIY